MTQIELTGRLVNLGFSYSGKTNTRKNYTYRGMTVAIIYGNSQYGIAISINNEQAIQKMYGEDIRYSINDWAYDEAYKYIATHS